MANMEGRLARLRDLMAERGYEAVVLRSNPDLRWLTGAARVFDDEVAHTAFVTMESASLHTDSRYYGSFVERLGEDGAWQVDMSPQLHARWVAEQVRGHRATCVAIEDSISLGFYEDLLAETNRASVACLMPRLHDDVAMLRLVKDEAEIEAMRRAQQVTDEAFSYICGRITPGLTELQIRADLEGYMLSNGADALSFDTIVGSGPNGANPHARPGSRKVRGGDMIVIDFGAAVGDYHADMTRTVCVGEPTAKQREVYEVVRRAHEACADAARPNMPARELHELAAKVITDAGYGDYFKHGLGHGVGLQIHERPSVGARSTDLLPEGAVFTIEPGIYLPGDFGVRLEDFGVMGPTGYLPFTESTHDLVSV